MDETTPIKLGVAALIAVLLVVAYVLRGVLRRATGRRVAAVVARYFDGDLPLDELGRQARAAASWSFLGSAECQAVVQAAFHRAAQAQLAGKAHSLEVERKLLKALAAVKTELGLPDRYQSEGWKPGRE